MDARSAACLVVDAALRLQATQRDSRTPISASIKDLLNSENVRDALGAWRGGEAEETFVILLAIAMARRVLDVWTRAHPALDQPSSAVMAAERWSVVRTNEAVDDGARAADRASEAAQRVWQGDRKAAWAGRTAAWAAMAPKHPWAAVAALFGAIAATSADVVADAMTTFFLARRVATDCKP